MAPVLGALADGGDHSLAELRTVLAERLGLTEEDLQAKIPSGTPLFANRLHWAVTYMHQVRTCIKLACSAARSEEWYVSLGAGGTWPLRIPNG
jgi:restriction endonuclease Mrr